MLNVKCCLNIKNINQLNIIQKSARYLCYVPIKRPSIGTNNFNKTTKHLNPEKKLSLPEQLRLRIATGGPLTVAQYMKYVLTQSDTGYYMHRDVFGRYGDFITAPEIGQIFGELLAIWIYLEWQKCGSPKPLQIVEFGPGRGTLIQDIIRVLSKFQLSSNLSIHLVEISEFLCELQAQILCVNAQRQPDESPFYYHGETITGIPVQWYHSVQNVPANFSVIIAHEFFDALPIHKFQKIHQQWREILVDHGETVAEQFRFIVAPSETPFSVLFSNIASIQFPNDQREHIEYSFERIELAQWLAQRLEEFGGFGLIMDYGHCGNKSDTFRAFKNHQLYNPLQEPGSADLTADVDFQQLQHALTKNHKLFTLGPVEQCQWIARMGGSERLNALCESTTDVDVLEQLKTGYAMLTDAQQMGTRFKFLAMFPNVLKEHLTRFPVNGFS